MTCRFEIALKVPRESILPEIDLVREFCPGNLERFRSNVDVLEAKTVRQVDKGQWNEITVETLQGNISVIRGLRANLMGISYRRNSS